jgi:hypothetical protein
MSLSPCLSLSTAPNPAAPPDSLLVRYPDQTHDLLHVRPRATPTTAPVLPPLCATREVQQDMGHDMMGNFIFRAAPEEGDASARPARRARSSPRLES